MVTQAEKSPALSQRVQKEKEALLSAPAQVDVERVKSLLEVYEETKGTPEVLRRARLLSRLCGERTIFIDGNPIAGTLTQYKYGAYPMPEIACGWLSRAKDRLRLPGKEALLSDEAREWLAKAVAYWKEASVTSRTGRVVREKLGLEMALLSKCGVGTEVTPSAFMGACPNYGTVLRRGLNAILGDIEEQQAKLADIGDLESLARWYFYQGASTCLRGVMSLSQRYSILAAAMASTETDPARKRELEAIRDACQHVPANPARSFREGVQAFWFVMMAAWMESPIILVPSPISFTQDLYPLYEQDRKAGRITDEEAIELIQFFFLKINSWAMLQPPQFGAGSQSRRGLQLRIGGLTPQGDDATNALDWLVVEAQRRIRLPEPLVGLVYHNRLADDFLLKCVDLITTGIGQPAFHDIEKAIDRALYYENPPLEEARNVGIFGCAQSVTPGYSDALWEGNFNVAKMIELALNDGRDPLTGIQLGPHTGDAESFTTYAEFREAVVKQMQYFVPLMRTIMRVAWNIERNFPVPFASSITNDCIRKGKDLVDGGARYSSGSGTSAVGTIDAANSLLAIRKLVFEDGTIAIKQLKDALAADFEGYEEIRRMCLDAPKYGNDDPSADQVARDLYNVYWTEHQRLPDYLGRPIKPEAYSIATHFAIGRFTGALPNGRKARTPLTDASVSAQPGTDRNGPTALVKSAARAMDTSKFGCNHFNMKFHPSALSSVGARHRFLSLIRTYFDLGGYHAQFNCVSDETLREAQLHPEEYRDLVVRVAGFSAYFVTLDKEVQDEIIGRTSLRLD